MLINELADNRFDVYLSDPEMFNLQIVVSQSKNHLIIDVASLISYMLTHAVENAFLTVKDPFKDGNSGTSRLAGD